MNWQPIETAPKGGKSVLVTDGRLVWMAWPWVTPRYIVSAQLTHWMPMPDPPVNDPR